ncbi:hypothetical protein CRE_19370 [Caenorhabditis remanei]|uniref:Uncharacterized protein n=1 Tax=Caenorhabditis remanei TaxID=31234 RepID=E3N581_CAERE|nr:hypothetical protein CRE_19370 [Caenorhabditis remanei]
MNVSALLPNKPKSLIPRLFEDLLSKQHRSRNHQEIVVEYTKLLIEQNDKIRGCSAPNEEELVELENIRNVLLGEWNVAKFRNANASMPLGKMFMLCIVMMVCINVTFDILLIFKINLESMWHPCIYSFEFFIFMVFQFVLYCCHRNKTEVYIENEDIENGNDKKIVLFSKDAEEKTNPSSYTKKVLELVEFYSKEIMPLQQKRSLLDTQDFLWIILGFSILTVSLYAHFGYFLIEFIKNPSIGSYILSSLMLFLASVLTMFILYSLLEFINNGVVF